MADRTGIEWTDATWNPVTGCTEVSPGCDRCYAKTFAERWRGVAGHYFEHGFDVQVRPDKLNLPVRWRQPRRVFVNSMSDLFHKDVPDEFLLRVWEVMAATPQHTYQILTKRPARMRSFLRQLSGLDPRPGYMGTVDPLPNVWLGVSVETQHWADIRIPALLDTPASRRFVSAEPLLGPVDLSAWLPRQVFESMEDLFAALDATAPALDWVIVGGESGHGARPMHPAWVRSVRDLCQAAGVPFLFKQWGAWSDIQAGGHSVSDYVTNDHRCQIVDIAGRLRGRPWPGWRVQDGTRDAAAMRRYSKHTAGRVLDDRTWDEVPDRQAL